MTFSKYLVDASTGDYDLWVAHLSDRHRFKAAFRALMVAGNAATPALKRGLHQADPNVVVGCCRLLDHYLDPDAIPDLMDNLDNADPGIRASALHALACDRCKEGVCRPGEDDVIPIAINMLANDEAVGVRQQAAGLLGPSVHRRSDVLAALEQALHADLSPIVRKIAGWWVPGGPRFEALRPRSERRKVAKKRSRHRRQVASGHQLE